MSDWSPTNSDELIIFTIYDHPEAHPDCFVVQRWIIKRGKKTLTLGAHKLAGSLKEARLLIPPGLYRLDRFQDDEPHIIENWI
jgi:hypothetical protein